MMNKETAGAADFRANLPRHLAAAEHGGKTTVVTRNGKPAAALIPYRLLARLDRLEDLAAEFVWEESGGEPRPSPLDF